MNVLLQNLITRISEMQFSAQKGSSIKSEARQAAALVSKICSEPMYSEIRDVLFDVYQEVWSIYEQTRNHPHIDAATFSNIQKKILYQLKAAQALILLLSPSIVKGDFAGRFKIAKSD